MCLADEPDNPFVRDVISSFAQTKGSNHEVLEGDAFSQRFPNLKFSDPVTGVLDPGAGVIMADKALLAVQDLAKDHGVVIMDSTPVSSVEDMEGKVMVGW